MDKENQAIIFQSMGPAGFEPAISSARGWHHTKLDNDPSNCTINVEARLKNIPRHDIRNSTSPPGKIRVPLQIMGSCFFMVFLYSSVIYINTSPCHIIPQSREEIDLANLRYLKLV